MIDQQAGEQAIQDLEDIGALKKLPGYTRYLERRLKGKVEEQRAKVLEGKLTAEELLIAQRVYQAMSEMAGLIESDEGTCRRLLAARTPEEQIPKR